MTQSYSQPQPGGQAPPVQQPVVRKPKSSMLLWIITVIGLVILVVGLVLVAGGFGHLVGMKPIPLPNRGTAVIELEAGNYMMAGGVGAEFGFEAVEMIDTETGRPIEVKPISGSMNVNESQVLGQFELERPTRVQVTIVGGTAQGLVLIRGSKSDFMQMLAASCGGVVVILLGGLIALVMGIWAIVRSLRNRRLRAQAQYV